MGSKKGSPATKRGKPSKKEREQLQELKRQGLIQDKR